MVQLLRDCVLIRNGLDYLRRCLSQHNLRFAVLGLLEPLRVLPSCPRDSAQRLDILSCREELWLVQRLVQSWFSAEVEIIPELRRIFEVDTGRNTECTELPAPCCS
jgi:hypothetical protein